MKLCELITENQVIKITANNRENALNELIMAAFKDEKIENADDFKKAIFDREKIISTGVGLGIALPHAKIDGVKDFFIMIGICENSIDWDSLDGEPVNLIFMIGGPNNDQKAYLQILAKLMLVVKNGKRRESILNSVDSQEVINLFREL